MEYLPIHSKRILKHDPINDISSFVGEEDEEAFRCKGNGALGRDCCIYALAENDGLFSFHCFVGNSIESDHDDWGWADAILGSMDASTGLLHTLAVISCMILIRIKHLFLGDDFGNNLSKWNGGWLASDGVIYFFPKDAEIILYIDPWKEYTSSLENDMIQHPEQLGCIFHPSHDMPTETNFLGTRKY